MCQIHWRACNVSFQKPGQRWQGRSFWSKSAQIEPFKKGAAVGRKGAVWIDMLQFWPEHCHWSSLLAGIKPCSFTHNYELPIISCTYIALQVYSMQIRRYIIASNVKGQIMPWMSLCLTRHCMIASDLSGLQGKGIIYSCRVCVTQTSRITPACCRKSSHVATIAVPRNSVVQQFLRPWQATKRQ